MTQDVTKNKSRFPSMKAINKTEAIKRGMIQNKNRELPFYPDLIYGPLLRPPENL